MKGSIIITETKKGMNISSTFPIKRQELLGILDMCKDGILRQMHEDYKNE